MIQAEEDARRLITDEESPAINLIRDQRDMKHYQDPFALENPFCGEDMRSAGDTSGQAGGGASSILPRK